MPSEPQVIPDKTLSEEDIVRPKLTMLYGPPGAGKTPAAATWPAPQVWIDTDQGMDSIMWAMKAGIVKHKISDFRTAEPSDERDHRGRLIRATGLWQVQDKLNQWLADDQIDKWQTLVIDTVSRINEFAMNAGMEVSGKYPSEKKPYSESGKISREAGITLIGIQDYRPAQSFVAQLFAQLKAISKQHRKWVVVVLHEYEVLRASDKIGEPPSVMRIEPSLFGQQRKDVVKDIDEVYYLKQEGSKAVPKFSCVTRGDGFTIARSRFGCLEWKIDWTDQALFPIIKTQVEKFYGKPLE